jgi:hypothetical protein
MQAVFLPAPRARFFCMFCFLEGLVQKPLSLHRGFAEKGPGNEIKGTGFFFIGTGASSNPASREQLKPAALGSTMSCGFHTVWSTSPYRNFLYHESVSPLFLRPVAETKPPGAFQRYLNRRVGAPEAMKFSKAAAEPSGAARYTHSYIYIRSYAKSTANC